jgi:Ni,Fe-hydrogenase III component G
MLANTHDVSPAALTGEAADLLGHGHRFVTITCLDAGDAHEVLYHFDKDYQLINLRVMLPKGATLPSISHLCFAAVVVENEMKDLFGLSISDMAIDYEGRFILSEGAPTAPMNKSLSTPGIGVSVEEKK